MSILWLTGLSGSGKSTIANEFIKRIYNHRREKFVLLDGDVLRQGLCSDLGFSIEDRKENMRRLIALCKLFSDNGINVITAFISPFEKERQEAKEIGAKIIYCNSSLQECEKRDVKGLYKKARSGKLKEFTGIDSPYEEPTDPDLILDTEGQTISSCVEKLIYNVNRIF